MGIAYGPLYVGNAAVTCTYFAASDPQISGRNYLYLGGRYYPAVSGLGSALRVGSLGIHPGIYPHFCVCYKTCSSCVGTNNWRKRAYCVCVWLTDSYYGNSLTFANTTWYICQYRRCNSTWYHLGTISPGSSYAYIGCFCQECNMGAASGSMSCMAINSNYTNWTTLQLNSCNRNDGVICCKVYCYGIGYPEPGYWY